MSTPRTKPKTICVVTGSRAEYGLLVPVLDAVAAHPGMSLRLAVTGAHLSEAHGLTVREIEAGPHPIAVRIDLGLTGAGDRAALAAALGRGVTGFAEAFAAQRPDAVVVLGDRYEILAPVQTALLLGIPVGHIHGGELTEGAFDDAIRHAITKMAALHFTAAEDYARRVRQMGEPPERVHVVGAPGLDRILALPRLDRAGLADAWGFDPGERFFVVTLHPETNAALDPADLAHRLLAALDAYSDHRLILTGANADPGGEAINAVFEGYAETHPERALFRHSLGQRGYFSAVALADAVVGNSSSGVIEVPSLRTPTVNLGDRQKGRLRAASVIDCGWEAGEIATALAQAVSGKAAADYANPYGGGDAGAKIAAILAATPLDGLAAKPFHDWPEPAAA